MHQMQKPMYLNTFGSSMKRGDSAKLCRFGALRVHLNVSLCSVGIFFVRTFPCYNLNLVLVVFCLNVLGFVLSTGYQVRIALYILDRNFAKAYA